MTCSIQSSYAYEKNFQSKGKDPATQLMTKVELATMPQSH